MTEVKEFNMQVEHIAIWLLIKNSRRILWRNPRWRPVLIGFQAQVIWNHVQVVGYSQVNKNKIALINTTLGMLGLWVLIVIDNCTTNLGVVIG